MFKLIVVSVVGVALVITGCSRQDKSNLPEENGIESAPISSNSKPKENELAGRASPPPSAQEFEPDPDEQISAFVRRIFQDKKGNLWFGTNGDGVIRYDGDALEYFSINEGFGGVAVRGIVEDTEGSVWSIVIDSKGIIWIGTLQGTSRFDGEVFTPFDLPEAEPDNLRGIASAKFVHSIMEDSRVLPPMPSRALLRTKRVDFGSEAGRDFFVMMGNLFSVSERKALGNNSFS